MSKKKVYKIVEHCERYFSNLDDALSVYQTESLRVSSDLVKFRDVYLIVCDEDISDEVCNEKQSEYV